MQNLRARASLLASLLICAAPIRAQVALPLKLDLEPVATVQNPSDPPLGYTVMLPTKTFTPGSYGWQTAPSSYFTATVTKQVLVALAGTGASEHSDRVMLLRDGHSFGAGAPNVFRASLTPNAKVRVRMTLGRLAGLNTPNRAMRVYAGATATPETLVTREIDPEIPGLQGLWARTLTGKASLVGPNGNRGGYRVIWFVASADANGELALRMESSPGYQVAVSSLEIHPYSPPPILLSTPHSGLLTNDDYTLGMQPADAQALSDGVAALNSGDTDEAETRFRAIANDPFAETVGLLWVAGWMGEAELGGEGQEWTLALEAIASLEGMTTPSDLVAEYLDRAREYRRAYKHWRLRGYVDGVTFEPETSPTPNPFQVPLDSPLLDNLNISEAMWRNVGAQQLAAVVDNPQLEIHPLFMKACAFLGANWYSRSAPNKWATLPSSLYTFNSQHFSLWKEFDASYAATVFSTNDELATMTHMATYDGDEDGQEDYDQDVPGSIIQHWQGEGSDVVHGEGATKWWDAWLSQAQAVVPASNTDWAAHQRRAREAMLGGHRWWIDQRFEGGEFGGGGGDDVEFLLLQVAPVLPLRNNESDLTSFAQTVIDVNLAPFGAGGTSEYFFGDNSSNSADVEHTAEYTGNPLYVALQYFWGDPYYLEYATQSLKHVDSTALGQPWTESVSFAGFPVATHTYPVGGGLPAIPHRKFLSWHFDAEGPAFTAPFGGQTIDTHGDLSLNGRALLPAWYVNLYNGNPEAKRLMREWAEWWWVVTMDDGSALSVASPLGPKPKGVLPALARFDGTAARPLLYGAPGTTNNEWWSGGYDFDGALVYSYFIYTGLFLERYLDLQTPAAERSDYLRPIWESSKLVAEYWRQTCHGCDLGVPITSLSGNPATPGTTWWTAAQMIGSGNYMLQVLQAMPYLKCDPVIAALPLHGDQIAYLEQALIANGPSYASELFQGDKAPLVEDYRANFDWLDACFPIGTNFVGFTDRAFLWSGDTLYSTLMSSMGGVVGALPLYVLDWERPIDAFGAPLGAKLQIATYVKGLESVSTPGGPMPRLTALLTNYETAPGGAGPTRDMVLRLWHQLPHGRYRLEYGPNDGNDGIASVQYTSPSFDFTRAGTTQVVPIPYATAGTPAAIVVQLTREADVAELPFKDAAVASRDIAVTVNGGAGTTKLEVTFHGLGTRPIDTTFEIWAQIGSGAPFLAESGALHLAAVSGLDPQRYTASRTYPYVPAGTTVSVSVYVNPGAATDSNSDNDAATRSFTYP